MKEKYEWIYMKYDVVPNLWCCDRCGEKINSPTPCRISTMIEMSKAFLKVHKKCKPKKKRED